MDPYSKRKKASETPPTAIRYDLPKEFRNQVIFIWAEAAGYTEQPASHRRIAPYDMQNMPVLVANQLFNQVQRKFCEAHGLEGLPGSGGFASPCLIVKNYFQSCPDDEALDIIEFTFNEIFVAQKSSDFVAYIQPTLTAADAATKLNRRLQEHAIGFRFEQGRIVQLDSEFLHVETTESAFRLLLASGYEGALEEFQLAHGYYRQGADHYDDCLTNCLKSLESTLKTICNRRNWAYNSGDTASRLVDLVFTKGLIPSYLQSQFGAIRTTLESGVPTIRNREGGHGSGEKPNDVPEYLAAYQLHLTASAIVFLIRANGESGSHQPQ
jgi:hypothetical protein